MSVSPDPTADAPAADQSAATATPALTPAAAPPSAGELRQRLQDLSLTDERRLGRRLAGLRKIRDSAKRDRSFGQIADEVTRAEQRIERRRAAVPEITYPDLPVAARAEDLAAAIAEHQVIIVAGETGSGKSTQLPKICLQLGRGVRGMIGHTQPRRIAARALAERIAEETHTVLGEQVGYTIRFGDHTRDDTLVKLMTDGILLAEIGRDRLLSRYDTIIIDEAHERSLNIDFLLGYLTRLLPQRPDLKVIITSATIDPERFSQHFGGAPIIEVSGRTYPVEVRYRPFGPDEAADDTDEPEESSAARKTLRGKQNTRNSPDQPIDQATAICQAVDELGREADGDILVFLSGEREITDTAEILRGHLQSRPGTTEVLPLYGRLSAAEQHEVFSAHSARRIVLATNVAETSLTVPGIRYVIDPGTARISRYSTRTKVQRLPIEKISQASAGQRAGRCGRVADGICIRLYAEDDFATRPEFTDPEIARTSLAAVILQMASLGLGEIESFPFVEPPDTRQITDGVRVLDELGALDHSVGDGTGDRTVRLTTVGRQLAALPVDPQYARMIVEANQRGCLAEILVIVAGLTVQDVREHPLEERDKATAVHARFADPHSDFLALVNLWHYLRDQAATVSGNAFRRMCRSEYLHYLRIREWQDLHAQLRQVARQLGMDTDASSRDEDAPARTAAAAERPAPDEPGAGGGTGRGRRRRGKGSSAFSAARAAAEAEVRSDVEIDSAATKPKNAAQQGKGSQVVGVDTEAVHCSLLSGLITHVGLRLEPGREYQGTRGTKFIIWPGSALAKSQPRFVMAAELVETTRLWGRTVARIDPAWAEKVGEHLLKRNHSEPRWDARRGAVVATEKVTLLGVTLVAARTVSYDGIDPELSRDLFIRHALVEADWETRHPWFAANLAALQEVSEREDRARRRDIVIDDDTLFGLYDARIPAEVTTGRHLDSWWRKESRENPGLLTFTPEMLVAAGARDVSADAFPDRFSSGGIDLDLEYVFDPSRDDDGVTVTIPLPVLARVDPGSFSAHVPGHRDELAVALLRTLPKTLRRNFVPAPDFARAVLARLDPDAADASADFAARFAAGLTAMTGIRVAVTDFDEAKLPDHLRMRFRIVDASGTEVAVGKNLAELQDELRGSTRDAVAQAVADSTAEVHGLRTFPPDGVEKEIVRTIGGQELRAFPALVDERTSVGITVFATVRDQQRAARRGLVRLLALASRPPGPYVRHLLTSAQMMTLATAPHGSFDALVADALDAALDALLDWAGGVAWTAAEFEAVRVKLAPHLDRSVGDVVVATEAALRAGNVARIEVDTVQGGALAAAAVDMRNQLEELLRPGMISRTGAAHLPDLERYLQALAVRAERARSNPERDRERLAGIIGLQSELEDAVAALRPARRDDPDVAAVRRMLQEFRVAQFAQPMRTAIPVSDKRIRTAISAMTDQG